MGERERGLAIEFVKGAKTRQMEVGSGTGLVQERPHIKRRRRIDFIFIQGVER